MLSSLFAGRMDCTSYEFDRHAQICLRYKWSNIRRRNASKSRDRSVTSRGTDRCEAAATEGKKKGADGSGQNKKHGGGGKKGRGGWKKDGGSEKRGGGNGGSPGKGSSTYYINFN